MVENLKDLKFTSENIVFERIGFAMLKNGCCARLELGNATGMYNY